MARINFDEIMVKDLPQPNQIWKISGVLIKIELIQNSVYNKKESEWMVHYHYINKDGSRRIGKIFRGHYLELGRFLTKAKRVHSSKEE